MVTTERHTTSGILTARAPFDFTKTLAFFRMFTPMGDEQTIAGGTLTKALTLDGRAVAFAVRAAGTGTEPALACTLTTELPLRADAVAVVLDRVRRFLSLDDDLEPFYALAHTDAAFAPVVDRLRGLHQPKFLTPFEIACWAILGQRVPMPIARRIKDRLVARYGSQITLAGITYRAFPEPAQLAAADPAELAAIVRNPRKIEYLEAVTAFFATADDGWLRTGDYAEVAARIRAIRGVGAWSSHFILVRGLGRMERAQADERELAKAAARVYNGGAPMTPEAIQRISEHYGDTQGYWAFYLRNAALAV